MSRSSRPPLVDTHVHVVSADRNHYPLSPSGLTEPWYDDHPIAADDLMVAMPLAGVERAVLVQAVSAYSYDNRYVLDARAAASATFVSVGAVDLLRRDPRRGLAELRAEGGIGVRFMIFGLEPEQLREPSMMDALAAVRRDGQPVMVLGGLGDTAVTVALLEQLAGVPVVLEHAPNAISDVPGSRLVPEPFQHFAGHEHALMKVTTATFDRLHRVGRDPRTFMQELVAVFGANRIVWGSNYPVSHDRPYEELAELARWSLSALDETAHTAIGSGTARSLWWP